MRAGVGGWGAWAGTRGCFFFLSTQRRDRAGPVCVSPEGCCPYNNQDGDQGRRPGGTDQLGTLGYMWGSLGALPESLEIKIDWEGWRREQVIRWTVTAQGTAGVAEEVGVSLCPSLLGLTGPAAWTRAEHSFLSQPQAQEGERAQTLQGQGKHWERPGNRARQSQQGGKTGCPRNGVSS